MHLQKQMPFYNRSIRDLLNLYDYNLTETKDGCSKIEPPTNFKEISNGDIAVDAGSLNIPDTCIGGYEVCTTLDPWVAEVFGCSNEYEGVLAGVTKIDDWDIGTNILGMHFGANFTGKIIKNDEIIAIFENGMVTFTETGLKALGLELNSDTGYLTLERYCDPIPGSETFENGSITHELPAYIRISPDGEKTPFRLFGNKIKIDSIGNQSVHIKIFNPDNRIPIEAPNIELFLNKSKVPCNYSNISNVTNMEDEATSSTSYDKSSLGTVESTSNSNLVAGVITGCSIILLGLLLYAAKRLNVNRLLTRNNQRAEGDIELGTVTVTATQNPINPGN